MQKANRNRLAVRGVHMSKNLFFPQPAGPIGLLLFALQRKCATPNRGGAFWHILVINGGF